MRLVFYYTDKDTDKQLITALTAAGHSVQLISADRIDIIPEADAYCFVGVKRARLARALTDFGKVWLYWDKAYNRDWPKWWRVTVNAQQPTGYLMHRKMPPIRAEFQDWLRALKPWRTAGRHIVFAGSSEKYHGFVDHPEADPTAYARDIIAQLRMRTQRRIVYRPKPSWKAAVPVPGADYSVRHVTGDIHQALEGAHALVTHGSSTCFDALLAGVPSIVLGDGVTASISSTSIDDIERPRCAHTDERKQLLANLAYCQWNLKELSMGAANSYLEWLVKDASKVC